MTAPRKHRPPRMPATNQTQAPPLDADPGATPPPSGPREFTLGQVLTLACADTPITRHFCSWGEFLQVVGYLLGDVPSIDGDPGDPGADPPVAPIPSLAEEVATRARPAVLAQYPDLATVDRPAVSAPDVTVLAWLADLETTYGPRLTLRPIESPDRDPPA